jgi:hypothetical protein
MARMKFQKVLVSTLLGLLFSFSIANAQLEEERLLLNFQATCRTTNEFGELVVKKMNTRSLIRECAVAHGITNINAFNLIYHLRGDERGDVIEVVYKTNGVVLCEVFGLFFPIDLTRAEGARVDRYAFMFNDQGSESMGNALIRIRPLSNGNGNFLRPMVTGTAHFFLKPEGAETLRICSGTFQTGKRFVVP